MPKGGGSSQTGSFYPRVIRVSYYNACLGKTALVVSRASLSGSRDYLDLLEKQMVIAARAIHKAREYLRNLIEIASTPNETSTIWSH